MNERELDTIVDQLYEATSRAMLSDTVIAGDRRWMFLQLVESACEAYISRANFEAKAKHEVVAIVVADAEPVTTEVEIPW